MRFWRRQAPVTLVLCATLALRTHAFHNNARVARGPGARQPRKRKIFVLLTIFLWGELRISLGLVDLSRTPCGTFFREVHPGSEMASQNDQNKAK